MHVSTTYLPFFSNLMRLPAYCLPTYWLLHNHLHHPSFCVLLHRGWLFNTRPNSYVPNHALSKVPYASTYLSPTLVRMQPPVHSDSYVHLCGHLYSVIAIAQSLSLHDACSVLILLLCSVLLRTTSHICIPNCFAIIILRMIFNANLQLLHRLNLNCSLASKNNRPPDYTLCIIVLWKNNASNLLYWLYLFVSFGVVSVSGSN